MTHEELEAIRLRAAETAKYLAPYGPDFPAYVRQHPPSYPSTNSALDVPALLAYIDELHSIVHDLRQEPGYALGRRDVLREVLNVLGKVPVTWNADHTKAVADPQYLAIVLDLIECLGPVAPHLAPDDLRRENEALRAALLGYV
jgi:hypothetical protein